MIPTACEQYNTVLLRTGGPGANALTSETGLIHFILYLF
jgi:hypothetical protein